MCVLVRRGGGNVRVRKGWYKKKKKKRGIHDCVCVRKGGNGVRGAGGKEGEVVP